MCNFAFKSPIAEIRDTGEFHLSCRGSYKAQEGSFFLFSRSKGGRGHPEKISEKMMLMDHSEPFLQIVNIFSKIVWDFCDDPEDLRNARVCSPLIKRGLFSSRVRGRSHPIIFLCW